MNTFVDVRRQRFGGRNLSANLVSQAFTLRELAFVEECRIQALAASVQRAELHS